MFAQHFCQQRHSNSLWSGLHLDGVLDRALSCQVILVSICFVTSGEMDRMLYMELSLKTTQKSQLVQNSVAQVFIDFEPDATYYIYFVIPALASS